MLKSVPKPVGIGIFWGICILVGIMVVSHNNPLAPDIHTENLKKFCACALLLLACVIFSVYYDRMFIIPKELFQSRELIWKLAKNDFKKRYAGSYLGFLWVFNISILPIIKLVAATFIHVFFAGVLLVVAGIYGYYPTIYTIQIVYYSFCLFVLMLAMSYCTCAITVFFRDLSQIINIGLQVGMWATPILWNIGQIGDDRLVTLVKLNPLVYIVNGYRNAIYGDEWFFEHFYSSTYFWIFTVTLFCVGSLIFKRLKVHFADVL